MGNSIDRDALFGDLPFDAWMRGATLEGEPWLAFRRAQAALARGDKTEALAQLWTVMLMEGTDPLQRLQAWHFLRGLGESAPRAAERDVLVVIVEAAVPAGLDVLAAYADKTVTYSNFSGAGVVWKRPDASLDRAVDAVLGAASAILPKIGPWKGPRRGPPPKGQARLNIVTPVGLHFGEAPFEALDRDPVSRPLLQAATQLMRAVTALSRPASPARPPS